MSQAAPTLFDRGRYDRALAILDRERPTPREEWCFLWMGRFVWAAIAFSVSWPVVTLSYSGAQYVPLFAAVVCYAGVALLFLANLSLIRRLWRAAQLARKLGLPLRLRVRTIDATAKRTIHRWAQRGRRWVQLGLHFLGYPFALFGLAGLSVEIPRGNWELAAWAAIVTVFSLACLLLYPMARVQERLEAISALRETVLRNDPQPPSAIDAFSVMERIQIETDRHRSIVERRDEDESTIAVRMTRAFQTQTSELPPDDAALVHQAVLKLFDETRRGASGAEPLETTEILPIEGCDLELEIRWDAGLGQIDVLGVGSRRTPRQADDVTDRNGHD